MSRRRETTTASPLELRLEALQEATELGAERIDASVGEASWQLLERASMRRTLSAEHTVVGFFGATGSGKSSLFNAVTGEDIARTAATRPTTSKPLAGIWGRPGSDALLDWLAVHERHVLDSPLRLEKKGIFGSEKEATGLILLDLPDFDSTMTANREIATKLAGKVDILVWVLDPQKYADAAVHHDFIRPLATHGTVTLVVLNQIDKLRENERGPVIDSLRSILVADGLAHPKLLGVSALTGEGIDALRQEIAGVVTERGATTRRLSADVAAIAEKMGAGSSLVELKLPAEPTKKALTTELAEAAGVDTVVSAVRRSYRLDAHKKTGWPLTRWLAKVRPDPLRRLNLKSADVNPTLNRTSLPIPGAAQTAQADSAVRRYAEQASAGAPAAWQGSIRRASRAGRETLPDELDQAIANTDIGARSGAWWWPVVSVIQWISLVTALAGALWLGALFAAQYFQFSLPEVPKIEGFPVPTLMVVLGILLGIVLGLAMGVIARIGAAGRARKARKALTRAVATVAARSVIEPVGAEITRHNQFIGALERARK
ncbi:GTPase [Paeniglutamicibacter gangotriensis]|uniref:GTPase Era n=1 Tax=Paeniglutamicibacter gangotriensis Lz1y TaxID=1276920 RepID=M7NDP8_9MICC|nr:GTPase [Paeniglutamicibacter gangotriensis]EMQ99949.1 GTPase Era [Paeniglutamicibacter gangotriensis Lz1y]